MAAVAAVLRENQLYWKNIGFFIFKNDDVSYLWLILYYTLT
jgi:hypothetical protein